MSQSRRGYLYGFCAYLMWGFFPLYFKHLLPAGPVEILSHRVIWSVIFVALVLTVARRWRHVGPLLRNRRKVGGIALAAFLIAINWFIYIYSVNTGHVVESSLGYFINPLIAVVLGVFVLGERLRPGQWVALAIGTVSVAVLTVDYGRLPWVALSLAVSFALYSLTKKRLGLPPADGLFVESSVLTLPALGFVIWLGAAYGSGHRAPENPLLGQGATFGTTSLGHALLLVAGGAITAVPLLLFAGAANRIPLTGIGILQYITPILQLIIGVAVYHERLPPARLVGFALVWAALIVFSADALRHARQQRTTRPPTSEAGAVLIADAAPAR